MGSLKFDLTGQRFGRLTVLRRGKDIVGKTERSTAWTCVCDCDPTKEIDIRSNTLRNGMSTSCGKCCNKYKQEEKLLGKTFGRLTVIKYYGINKNSVSLWECSCSCGNPSIIKTLPEITKLKYPNCGCYKKEQKDAVNQFEFKEDYCIFYIKGVETYIDAEDYEKVNKHTWHIGWRGYILSSISDKRVQLHRILMNAPKNMVIDHINGNILDNRKSNLRIVTMKENCQNRKRKPKNQTSQYFGVHWDKNKKKWISCIRPKEKTIFLGMFNDEIEAAKAYNQAAEKYGYLTRNILPKEFPEDAL